jgi:hypothetical protein
MFRQALIMFLFVLFFAFICLSSTAKAGYIYPPHHTTGRSMFVWHKSAVDTTTEQAALVSFCQSNKINVVLISIYDWIGRYSWSTSNVDGLKALVSGLKSAGIGVYAVAGNSDWTIIQNWVKRTVLEPVRQYQTQATNKEQFDGFVFDVEYFVPDNNPQLHVPLMCNLMKDTRSILGLPVGLWAPWWQITNDRSTGLVTYDGVSAPEGVHWMRVADMVFVGAYSDLAESAGSQQGQMSMMEQWVSHCNVDSKRTAVWATSETKNISSDWQSYYEEDVVYMEYQHELIADFFMDEDLYGSTCFVGQSIHYYDSYRYMSGF